MSRPESVRYLRVALLSVALGATILFAFWTAGMLPPPRFTHEAYAAFEWNSSTGFSKFDLQGSFLRSRLAAWTVGSRVDVFLRTSHLKRATGEVEVTLMRGLPIVLGGFVDGDMIHDPDETPLMKAAFDGDIAEVRHLLPLSDVNAKDQAGQTALIWSCLGGNAQGEIIKSLLAAGAHVNPQDIAGRTALFAAAAYPAQIQQRRIAIDALLAAGADPNLPDRHRNTPLMRAADLNDTAIARALLAKGAKPDVKNSAGHTALSIAQSRGNADVVKLLTRSLRSRNRPIAR